MSAAVRKSQWVWKSLLATLVDLRVTVRGRDGVDPREQAGAIHEQHAVDRSAPTKQIARIWRAAGVEADLIDTVEEFLVAYRSSCRVGWVAR